jgi:SPP1 gp7 family putative phage head morphogenesis protein
MKLIPPIPLKDRYWREIKKEIERIFNEVLFIPLYEAAKIPKELKNAPSTPLEKAIADGTVFYRDGKFQGKFSAAISKEIRAMGGKWNAASKTFTYTATLPAGVSFALATAVTRYDTIKQAVLTTLDNLNIESIDQLGDLPDKWTKTIEWASGDWEKAVKGITVSPELTEGELNSIALDYSHSTSLPIKNWADETVLDLREKVQQMVYQGQRPDAIAKLIENKYAQSRRKAQFIARQESSLFLSSFHRARMKDISVKRWVWVSVMDERTREEHRHLDGKIFLMDAPPTDSKGQEIYPGTPFGCRCTMKALIE